MNLIIDLNKIKKSKPRFYFGLVMLLFSIIVFFYSMIVSDWVSTSYSLFFVLVSFNHIYEGKGKLLNSIFGKRFIIIDEERVSIKIKTFKKAQTINWSNIDSIKYGLSRIELKDKKQSLVIIEYGNHSYELVQKIKETLSAIEKSILNK